jgi:hypothetical protein
VKVLAAPRILWRAAVLLAGLLCAGAAVAAAQPAAAPRAPADSSFESYIAGLRDSSHAFFMGDTLAFDTTGTDSLDRLFRAHPELAPQRAGGEYDDRRMGGENSPLLRINTKEGLYAGARLQLGGTGRWPGGLSGMAGWSFRLHESRFAAGWSRTVGGDNWALSGHISAYRSTEGIDAAQVEPDPLLEGPQPRARRDEMYFRREGWRARALLRTRTLAFEAQYRDEQAHWLEYPGTDSGPVYSPGLPGLGATYVPANRVVPGTVRALAGTVALGSQATDGLLKARFEHAGFGGKFDFNRTRVSAARLLRLGSVGLLALQAEWSAADSGAPYQELSFAGGSTALQGYPAGFLCGRQMYLGRATLLVGPDILASLKVKHPAWLPLSLGLFAETGAVPALQPGDGLNPRRPSGGSWASDVGVGLWYRPGLPDPFNYVKLSAAVPVGPFGDHKVRWTLAWGRLLDWF